MKLIEINKKDDWDNLYSRVKKFSLTQDWDYAESRYVSKSIVIKRYKIINENKFNCIFQVVIRKFSFFPFVSVVYLNRGPLILNSSFDFELFLKLISKKFSISNGYLILFNPFVPSNSLETKSLSNNRFINFKRNIYETSYINLNKSLDELRMNLHSKWRNQLVKAEKTNLKVKTETNGENLSFILNEYKKMLSIKGFDSISIKNIKGILEYFINNKKVLFLIGYDLNNKILGFTCLLRYGNSAIYFIGWSNQIGRNLNVSNLLLWNSIIKLKNLGYSEFDLGGYDSIRLPGISKFKKRIGGDEIKYSENWLKIF